MKIKLGVIGSLETVGKIEEVLQEFEEKVEAFIYPYVHKKETLDIFRRCQDKVDVLLFSGQVPYAIVNEEEEIKKPFVFIPRVGTSVYRAFWQMNVEGIDYKRISFDTIEQEAIEEVLKELDIPTEKIYVKSYPGDIDYSELVEYHHQLWIEKKINVAATCLSETYRVLKDRGVPVYRLFPTRTLIREYIYKAVHKGSVEKIKATQIAVQIVKIKNNNQNISSEYEFLKLKNKLEEGLIAYTQDIFGSIFPFGREEYLIFTTRGAIDPQCEGFKIMKSDQSWEGALASGIGFGDTVHEAEIHARTALDYAMKETANSLFIVDEKGMISGPICEEDPFCITYELTVADEEMKKVAEKIQISATYVSKIKAIIDTIGRNTIEAEELSNYLGISVRSARRILKQMVDANYARIAASESRKGMGRPRKVYEISL